jgi:hypothetical protein
MSWQVTNPASNGPVTWAVNKGEVQWVTVTVEPGATILQGGEQATIVATIDKSGLEPGDYRTDIVFTITFEPNDKKREPSSVVFPVTVTIPNPGEQPS